MGVFFETFTARTIWTPELIVVLAVISFVYFMVITKFRAFFPEGAPVPTRRVVYFHLGLLAVYLGFGGPLYVLGHINLSMHMLSMAIVYLIAPPLLLIGIPSWFFNYFARFSWIRRLFTIVGFPILGLVLFNALFSFYHLPFTFDFVMTNEGWHNVYQIGMLLAAMLMWWHIIPRLTTKYDMSELKRIGYMFASGVLFTPACVLVIFAGSALYATYTDPGTWATAMAYCLPPGADIPYEVLDGEQSLTLLSPYRDQQFGGALMKITQELAYGVAMGYTFRIWMQRDRSSSPQLEVKEYDMYQPENANV
ncbi:cytochrome c oxidase assembly factor CtaG [Salisediminibacterium halotolerans]|uniref:Membrane protein n=1 Tax=Salisediminibacterium halotolerans TaxID=517425 RepID=A0A1H9VF04_9BACI|nr:MULTISPECIES: cytochrome c oxidase assembly factor CtaG [Salisediminibacterium]RLJ74460.1 putative membrane protein [Actinophytocola xinjiangensis]RPE87447.1 putative membrane protein [Salisediminibacterium halotolerans]TWG35296.1 putative membrane protein [Salisediminibacterium halotolerans]SES20222.1 putative membrane protein [Salisediminibacterium haloalkalitolerans]GEL06778.1 cytochrome c oxidase assembly factor CtaG [Salisediminibacterium halotolerans]